MIQCKRGEVFTSLLLPGVENVPRDRHVCLPASIGTWIPELESRLHLDRRRGRSRDGECEHFCIVDVRIVGPDTAAVIDHDQVQIGQEDI